MNLPLGFGHVRILGLGAGVVVLSLGLTFLNSFLMTKGNFPYAMPILLCHTIVSSVCAGFLYRLRPILFTSLTKRPHWDVQFLLKAALPIALAFMSVNVLNSVSLRYSDPAFLTMMKKGGLMVIYGFSLALKLEPHRWDKTCVVAALVPAMMLTIGGEANTSFFGVLICGSCVLLDAAKNILQAMVLSHSAGWDLDAYTYVLVVSPLCSICLGFCLMASMVFGEGSSGTNWENSPLAAPPWDLFYLWKEWVLLGATVAFLLNTLTACFVREVSAMGYQITSIAKDVLIVVLDAHVLKDTVTHEQWFGFVLQLVLVVCWARVKLKEQSVEEARRSKDDPQQALPMCAAVYGSTRMSSSSA